MMLQNNWAISILIWVISLSFGMLLGPRVSPYISYELNKIIVRESQQFQLDPQLIRCLILAESKGSNWAHSHKGARGAMQLMPSTAMELAQKLKLNIHAEDLWNPEVNIKLGCCYIQMLMQRFEQDLVLVLAAYNTGPSRVARWRRELKHLSPQEIIQQRGSRETKAFVARVLQNYQANKQ